MFPIPKRYRLKSIDKSLKWYILWVNSRQYQTQIHDFLHDYAVWIPGTKTAARSGDDCVEISEPLFPGYIFVGVTEEKHLQRIAAASRKASLCFYFMRDSRGHYSPLASQDLDRMVSAATKSESPNYNAGLRVGRRVRIAIGPYSGTTGRIVSMTRKDIRVEATCRKKDLLVVVNRMNYLVLEPVK